MRQLHSSSFSILREWFNTKSWGKGSALGKLQLPTTPEDGFYSSKGVWCFCCCLFCFFFSLFKCGWGLNLLSLCVVVITGWSGIFCANKALPLVNLSVHKAWLNWRFPADLKAFYVKYMIRAFSPSVSLCKGSGTGETANTQSEAQLK